MLTAIRPVTSNGQSRCFRGQCNRVLGYLCCFNEISRPPSLFLNQCVPFTCLVLHCVFVSSVCTCVYTHDENLYMSAVYAFRVKLWLERVELPLFSVAASVLHDCRYLPGCVYIPYSCYLCTLERHHSRISRIQFLVIYRFSLHQFYTRGLAICLSSAGCSAAYTGFLVGYSSEYVLGQFGPAYM